MITAAQLAKACGCNIARATLWWVPLTSAMGRFGITGPAQQAAFLAQVAHESGRLVYVVEMWGPTAAQTRYEGRRDLGNARPGDGFRYRGRGLIQTTGRANYAAARDGLRRVLGGDVPDFEATPEKLAEPMWAAMSAAYFWASRGCAALCGDFEALTRRINGGTNGLADRLALWDAAKVALGAATQEV